MLTQSQGFLHLLLARAAKVMLGGGGEGEGMREGGKGERERNGWKKEKRFRRREERM